MADVTIEISRKKKRKVPAGHRRGPLDIKRDDDRLARRRRPGVEFSFYDPGQINIGSDEFPAWADNSFFSTPSLALAREDFNNTGSGIQEGASASIGRFFNWASYFSHLFSIPIENWKDHYRKIQHDCSFSYSVRAKINEHAFINGPGCDTSIEGITSGGDLTWTANATLKTSKSVNRLLISCGPCYEFDTGSSNFFITDIHDPGAPHIIPHFASKVDVYLIPRLVLQLHSSEGTGFYDPPHFEKQDLYTTVMNAVIKCYSRIGYPAFSLGYNALSSSSRFAALFNWLAGEQSKPYSRLNTIIRRDAGTAFVHTTVTFNGSGGGFPQNGGWRVGHYTGAQYDWDHTLSPLIGPRTTNYKVLWPNTFPGDTGFFDIPSDPFLVGVLGSGDSFYYIWTSDPFWAFQQIDHYNLGLHNYQETPWNIGTNGVGVGWNRA